MNTIFRSLAHANGVRLQLGAGEPGLYPLLGGWGAGEEDSASTFGGGSTGAVSRLAKVLRDTRLAGGSSSSSGGGSIIGTHPHGVVYGYDEL